MCGIAGFVTFDPAAPADRPTLAAMTDVIAHRGPDAGGFYLAPGVGLGHRRLSIIDLATGGQPLGNENGSVQVVFNGEIYNFAGLREELARKGHRFRTHTDTEVIVHGYEQWGEACVERFRGMFAFALWDGRHRRLLLARDRVGIKPLYYAVVPGRAVVFGSEIKSLLEYPGVSREWSVQALDAYLALAYVPAPATIYKSVQKLMPAHTLVVERGTLHQRRYWDLHFTGTGSARREGEYLEQLDALLHEAVKIRLVSDVSLGAFLSGGIDSSAVVAAMADTSDAPVITTAVGFDDQDFSEVEHARTVADHLGVGMHTHIVTPEVADLLPKLAWHLDEPFGDSSAVPTYYVSKAAREHVTVALSGDGGDEMWAGYARHRVEHAEASARAWLGPLGGTIAGALAHAVPGGIKGMRSLRHLVHDPADACATKHAYDLFEAHHRRALYEPDVRAALRGSDPFALHRQAYVRCASPDPLDRALYVDARTYLVDDILTKVDKMSMAVSLEARVPLLDHKLLEFAATIPSSLKLRGGTSKYLLKKLLARRLPPAILQRPKHGFDAPIAGWLRGSLAPLVQDLLFDGRLAERGLFRRQYVTRLWNEHRRGRRNHRHRLWSLVMLELWFRQFVDRDRVTTPARPASAAQVA